MSNITAVATLYRKALSPDSSYTSLAFTADYKDERNKA
jgi:hypothetical protein